MVIGRTKKETKMNVSIGLLHIINLAIPPVYTNFEDSDLYRSCEICDRMIIGEKEKLTNKMNDKQGAADILKHNTISHT